MFGRKKNLDPIIVVVANGRYEMFGEPTPRNIWLAQMLKAQGGVNESVVDGTYHYNVLRVGRQYVASLHLIDE